MKQKTQIYVLCGLLVILAAVWASNLSEGPSLVSSTATGKFRPLDVANPSLRLDLLERIRKLEYKGSLRNPFEMRAAPPPPQQTASPGNAAPPGPPPEQPLVVPYKFFGFSVDPRSGSKRAFFTDGEDVFILAEGETLKNAFRLLRIGNTTAEMEEVRTGKRATLQMEMLPGPGGAGS
jgi:hypothetical protein